MADLSAEDLKALLNTKLAGDYVMLGSEVPDYQRVQTGLLSLDVALGGGLPLGVPISVQGKKNVGKSALCYHFAEQALQQYGGVLFLVQTEHGYDRSWAEACGVSPKKTIFSEIDKLENALNLILSVLRDHKPRVVLLDSLSMLDVDTDGMVGNSKSRGERAKPTNDFFRKVFGAIDRDVPPLFLYTEHLYPNVSSPYGGYITTGGETKGYANVLELRLQVESYVKEEWNTGFGKPTELPVQAKVQWTVEKSKCCPKGAKGTYRLGLRDTPFCQAGAINDFDELLNAAIYSGHIQKKGSWFIANTADGEVKGQGETGLATKLGIEALRELALRPREAGGKDNGQGYGDEAEADVRGGEPEGGSGSKPRASELVAGAKSNRGRKPKGAKAVAPKDQ